MKYFVFPFVGAGDLVGVAMINNISATHTPLPLLTQDDSNVAFCNANNLPSNCDGNSICHCNHMIELDVCKTYEFFLIDGGSKNFNTKSRMGKKSCLIFIENIVIFRTWWCCKSSDSFAWFWISGAGYGHPRTICTWSNRICKVNKITSRKRYSESA